MAKNPRSEFSNGTAFACPECGAFEGSDVIDSRPSTGEIRRRRRCVACDARFTTFEAISPYGQAGLKKTLAGSVEKLRALATQLERFAENEDAIKL